MELNLTNEKLPDLTLILFSIPEIEDKKLEATKRRLLRLLKQKCADLDQKRQAIQLKYCQKGSNGLPIFKDEHTGELSLDEKQKKSIELDWNNLNHQLVGIEIDPSNKLDFTRLGSILSIYQVSNILGKKTMTEDEEKHCALVEEFVKITKTI